MHAGQSTGNIRKCVEIKFKLYRIHFYRKGAITYFLQTFFKKIHPYVNTSPSEYPAFYFVDAIEICSGDSAICHHSVWVRGESRQYCSSNFNKIEVVVLVWWWWYYWNSCFLYWVILNSVLRSISGQFATSLYETVKQH